jgi:hypothetical protein
MARVAALLERWGEQFEPRYADGSRETLRDETFPKWLDEGALRVRAGIKTTSSRPRWALTASFADLFDPELAGDELLAAIDAWRDAHMSPGGRLKALTAQQRAQRVHAVSVTLPDGETRSLEPGEASVVLKGVIEVWARRRLRDGVVLTISEPGDKVYMADRDVPRRLGVAIDATTLLPDAVLVDIGVDPPTFWVVEVVATDGPIDEGRKRASSVGPATSAFRRHTAASSRHSDRATAAPLADGSKTSRPVPTPGTRTNRRMSSRGTASRNDAWRAGFT